MTHRLSYRTWSKVAVMAEFTLSEARLWGLGMCRTPALTSYSQNVHPGSPFRLQTHLTICPSEPNHALLWTVTKSHRMFITHILFLLTFLKLFLKLILYIYIWASLVAQRLKHLPAMQETWVRSLGWEDPLEKGMATYSSILAWRIPWMEEPGGLPSTGSQRVGHDWATSLIYIYIYMATSYGMQGFY